MTLEARHCRFAPPLHVGPLIQGLNPVGGLVEAVGEQDATLGPVPFLYGSTRFGGKGGRGILFRIPLDGDAQSLRVLYDFDLYTSGRSSLATPMLGPKGLPYGVTYQGGAYDKGAFYTLNPVVPPAVTTHDANLTGGVQGKNDEGFPLNDPMVEVWTGVTASQSGTDANGKLVTISFGDGIMVRARCPNPHIVQFVHRERISPLGYYFPDTVATYAGTFPMDTSSATPRWHTDVPWAKDSAQFGRWNAYLDQASGAAHQSSPTMAAIFDKPTLGEIDDPRFATVVYPLSGQDASNPQLSQTWRATARDFVICNCQVAREVRWAREVHGGKKYFAHLRVFTPAPDVLQWINGQLRKDGYAAIP